MPAKKKVCKEECKDFVPSHIDVFSLDHPGNKEVSEKILTTFQKIDPDKPSPDLPREEGKPWACLRCTFVTTCRKRALLHFRLAHDLRDLWSRFHICQIMPEKGKESEEMQNQYRLHRPLLCVLCGRDYVNKSAVYHITKDHPGISNKQIPLVIIKKEAGPKLIILYLYGRPPITYLLDTKGRIHEVKKIDTSLLKQKVSFAFQEIKPPVPISIDGEPKEEDENETSQRYQVEVFMYGCSLAEDQPGGISVLPGDEEKKPPEDLSKLRTKLLERINTCNTLPTKKSKINASSEIKYPRYTCKVCHAASNSKNIQEMHHITHPKQVGKWECTLCGDRFTKANLILTHIGVFHDLLANQALSHMKAIGVEVNAKQLFDQQTSKQADGEDEGTLSAYPEGTNVSDSEGRESKSSELEKHVDEANCNLPSTEEMDVWKKQLQNIKNCEICCKPVNNDAALMKHMRLAHKIRNYRCPVCSTSFISYSYLVYHMEETHMGSLNNENYLCTSCSRVFTCRNDFVRHSVNHIKDNFKCNICNETLLSADKLSLHVKTHYPTKALLDTPYFCPICNKVIRERKKVEMHLITHCTTMIEAYRCTLCTKTCVTEQGLRTHMKGHKVNKEMVCHICGKVFKRPHRLRDHLRMHENPDPFKCRICQKMVCSEEGMKRHMENVHSTTRKKEVVCHLCGKELASNYSLTMHLKLVHNPNKVKKKLKSRTCQYCNKVYSKPYQLAHHIDVHHAGRNFYACKYCGEIFSSRSLYRRHIDIHPEFKPWRCNHCTEKFVFQKSLLDHVAKSHPGHENAKLEKRFLCKICGNTYGKLWSLRNHLDVEHNDQRELANCEKIKYYCPFCNRGFLYKTGLDIHMSKAHKEKMNAAEAEVEMVAVEAVAHEETVALVQVGEDTCIIEAPATITLEQEAAVHLLNQLQFQVEQNYVVQ
ncbi:zinc finger protein 26-like [Pecten maximus]|uniref:zinc finger protein 26-like n=1 Tax=Pecten maximus TaxID=6579 RepID=UPI001458CEA0|nr:zinc finger protein 26-like [Pecten maximus]